MTEASRIMTRPRRILLATDLSARCDRALDRAANLAATWQAELIAVHALERASNYASAREHSLPSWRRPPDMKTVVEQQLRRDMLQAAPNVTAIVEEGEPSDVILRTAAKYQCELIVTGIARDETLGRFGLGATVDRLLKRSRVPLLIVKQRVRGPYGNILVTTDLSESSRHALRGAMGFFPDHRLSILHAFDPPMAGMTGDPARYREDYKDMIAGDYQTFLDETGLAPEQARNFHHLVEYGHPSLLVRQYATDRGVDLVVLGTHGRSGFLDILIGSTAKEILSELSCDALVIREPRAVVES